VLFENNTEAFRIFGFFGLKKIEARNRFARDFKELGPSWVEQLLESSLVKPPRRDTRALSPAGMFGGKALLRLVAQKSRPHATLAPMRSAPAYFRCKWGV
jgi:hypothetical protein